MTPREPSRLWRRLNAQERLFSVQAQYAYLYDHDVSGITMQRGQGSAVSGVTTPTCDVDVPGAWPAAPADSRLRVALTTYALQLLGLPESCRTRWTGRIASQRVADVHDNRRTTRFTGQGWAAQVNLATRPQRIARSERSGAMLERAWAQVGPPAAFTVSGDTDTAFMLSNVDYIDVPAGEVWSKWAADVGVLVRTLRSGDGEALGLNARVSAAANWRATVPQPLTRRVCTSPAEWVQPVTNPASIEWKRRASGGAEETVIITVGYGTTTRAIAAGQLDTSHANRSTLNQERMANAAANRATALGYRVETVTVDLVNLATSDIPSDRALLVQLLDLEEGDPLSLSHDWPREVSGIHYVSQITETVTPSGWQMTLALDPSKHITGEESPDPAGDTWDTAYPLEVSWDEFVTATWDTPQEV